MKVTSTDFEDGGEIPMKFGYNFDNVSPELEIRDIPKTTKSIALIMDDPDAMGAVGKVWVHWLACNIKYNVDINAQWNLTIMTGIPSGKLNGENFAILGKTDFGEIGYGGPAPPDKRHTYFFTVYALDKELELKEGFSKRDLENAMKDHIIVEATLTGTFSP